VNNNYSYDNEGDQKVKAKKPVESRIIYSKASSQSLNNYISYIRDSRE